MAKRSRSEALDNHDPSTVNGDSTVSKRRRKDKSASKTHVNGETNGLTQEKSDITNHQNDALTRKESSTEVVQNNTAALEAEARAEKKERKASKKAKKEARVIAHGDGEDISSPIINGASAQESLEVAPPAKPKRKSEKAAKKQAKAERKVQNGTTPLDPGVVEERIGVNGIPTKAVAIRSTDHSSLNSTGPAPRDSSGPLSGASTMQAAYTEHPSLSALPQADIDTFSSSNFITVDDPLKKLFRPITAFSYLPLTDKSSNTIFGTFTSPTPIQAAAWPYLLAGRDVIGVAETGSGKTLAFGVPCVRYLTSLPPKKHAKGIKAVMVSPTRELAVQIYEQLEKLAKPAGFGCVCLYGGVPKDEQRKALKSASIVVATPGRLNDLINEGVADLSKVGYLVLDEADRMLDKGFEEDIRKIIGSTPATPNRQTLMFTATWPPSIRELASTFMTSPVKITIGDNATGELRANNSIKQFVEVVDPRGKETRLLQLLKQHQSGKNKDDRILVFCLYKKEATRVENFIRSKGMRVAAIHGDMSQTQRMASLDSFKSGRVPLLIATDVAARGLDIPAVKLVINVTFPLTVEDYVHRIGRTGRAGKEGTAITLFTEYDKAQAGALINVLKAANQTVPEDLLKFGTTVKKKEHQAYGAFYKDVDVGKKATKITFD